MKMTTALRKAYRAQLEASQAYMFGHGDAATYHALRDEYDALWHAAINEPTELERYFAQATP